MSAGVMSVGALKRLARPDHESEIEGALQGGPAVIREGQGQRLVGAKPADALGNGVDLSHGRPLRAADSRERRQENRLRRSDPSPIQGFSQPYLQ
jgi:hypothetical protein